MAEARRPVSARRRVMAWVAIGSAVLLGVAVAVLLVRHALALILCLVGLGLAVAGGWWVLTERTLRRAVGVVGLVAGIVVMLVALVRVATGGQILLRVAILVVLIGITGWAARAATAPEPPASAPAEVAQPVAQVRWRPQRAVLICNPWSGGGKVERFGLLEYAAELGVETVLLDHGLDLEQLARDAIARGADCLGMAGGDGSQALVASIAIEHDLPFVCVSAGTRNHFAMDLCLDREDPRKSMLAFRDAVERRVDYARVGGRLFVNNVSLGIYATIVQQDSYRDAKIETSKQILPDLLGRQAEPFDLRFTAADGSEVDGAFMILVSNNPYVLGATPDASTRRRLDTGRLGIVAVSSSTGAEAAALITRSAIGLKQHDPNWHEFIGASFEVRSRSGTAFAGVDGEALELPTPLVFTTFPGGLRLLVPDGNLEAAAERAARTVDTQSILDIALGKDGGGP